MNFLSIEEIQKLRTFRNVLVLINGQSHHLLKVDTLAKLVDYNYATVDQVCDIIRTAINSEALHERWCVSREDFLQLCIDRGWAGTPNQWRFWSDSKSNGVPAADYQQVAKYWNSDSYTYCDRH